MGNYFDQTVDFFDKVQRLDLYQNLLQEFISFIAPQKGLRALDVGCGPGYLAREPAKRTQETGGD